MADGIVAIPGPFYHHHLTPERPICRCGRCGCSFCRRPWSVIRRRRVLIQTCEVCGLLWCDTCWHRRLQTVAERVLSLVGTDEELDHVVILCPGCKS